MMEGNKMHCACSPKPQREPYFIKIPKGETHLNSSKAEVPIN